MSGRNIMKFHVAIDKRLIRLRDILLSKYPLTHTLLQLKQEESWVQTLKSVIEGDNFLSVSQIVDRVNLQITARYTNNKSDIDVSGAAFPFLLDVLYRISTTLGERIYIYSDDGTWTNLGPARFKSRIQTPSKSGSIEIAVIDRYNRVSRRFSVNLWRAIGNHMESTSRRAPVKKVLVNEFREIQRSDWPAEPIDVVYTWVNSNDKKWQELIYPYKKDNLIDNDRFAQADELKYSLRALSLYAPWIRNIYIFSNCSPPEWFVQSDCVRWVMHEDVVPGEYLPLFNSHAIETFLHEIPGLAEQYIYFNDDVFLSGFCRPEDFFTSYGQSLSRLEPFGIVPYLAELVSAQRAEDWQHAAVNCANALQQYAGIYPTRLHRHTPHAFLRSTYTEMIAAFPVELEVTRRAKFRKSTDLSFTSFLYHHFAAERGKAVNVDEDGMIVRASNYQRFEKQKIYNRLRFFCINDGGGSSGDDGFHRFKIKFLSSHFQFKSAAEL